MGRATGASVTPPQFPIVPGASVTASWPGAPLALPAPPGACHQCFGYSGPQILSHRHFGKLTRIPFTPSWCFSHPGFYGPGNPFTPAARQPWRACRVSVTRAVPRLGPASHYRPCGQVVRYLVRPREPLLVPYWRSDFTDPTHIVTQDVEFRERRYRRN